MKAIIGLAVFLTVFSLAKNIATTVDNTVDVLQKHTTKTELYAVNMKLMK